MNKISWLSMANATGFLLSMTFAHGCLLGSRTAVTPSCRGTDCAGTPGMTGITGMPAPLPPPPVPPLPPSGAGLVDPAKTRITLDRMSVPADDVEAATVTVQLADSQGSAPEACDVSLSASDPLVGIDAATVKSNGLGEAVFVIHARAVLDATLTASLSVAGSSAPAATALVHFVQAQPDPSKSSVTFSRHMAILADGMDATEATVTLKTAKNGVPYGSKVAIEAAAGSGVSCDTPAMVDATGTATLQVRSHLSGNKTLSALVNDTVTLAGLPAIAFQSAPLAGPATFQATVVDEKITATADGNDAIALTVLVPTVSAGVSREANVVVSVSGSMNVTTDVTTLDEPVSLHLELRSTKAERKTITVIVNGNSVAVMPSATVTFVPGPADASASSLILDNSVTSPTALNHATLIVRDKLGNPRVGDAVTITAPMVQPNHALVLSEGVDAPAVTPSAATTDAFGSVAVTLSGGRAENAYVLCAALPGGITLEAPYTLVPPWASALRAGPAAGAQVVTDPADATHLYALDNALWESHDGGRSFTPGYQPDAVTLTSITASAQAPLRVYGSDGSNLYYFDASFVWQKVGALPPNTTWYAVDHENSQGIWAYARTTCPNNTACVSSNVFYSYLSGAWVSMGDVKRDFATAPNAAWYNQGTMQTAVVSGGQLYFTFELAQCDPTDQSASVAHCDTTLTFTNSGIYHRNIAGVYERVFALPDNGVLAPLLSPNPGPGANAILRDGSGTQVFVELGVANGVATAPFLASDYAALTAVDANGVMSFVSYTNDLVKRVGNAWQSMITLPARAAMATGLTAFAASSDGSFVLPAGVLVPANGQPYWLTRQQSTGSVDFSAAGTLLAFGNDWFASAPSGHALGVQQMTNWNPTEAIAGFSDSTAFMIEGSQLLDVDTAAFTRSAVTQDAAGQAIGTPMHLWRQALPANKRFLLSANGVYERVFGGQWTAIACAPFSNASIIKAIVVDPETGDVFVNNQTPGSLVRFVAGPGWQTISVSGMGMGTRLWADPRTPGALIAADDNASCGLFHKAPGSETWTPMVYSAACPLALDFQSNAAPSVVAYVNGAALQKAVVDGNTAPTWLTCKAATGTISALSIDPTSPRHLLLGSSSGLQESFSQCD